MTLFDKWLTVTRELQETTFHVDYSQFSCDENDPERVRALVAYVAWNTKAANHELKELDDETSWKPWASDAPFINRNEVIGEAVDALHFIANILCAVDCDEIELNGRYLDKMEKNRARQRADGGYRVTGPGMKCRICARALDDVAASASDPTICENCARTGV